jgi:uncharacterized membrane protein YcgQ (UPF0703/DUF1980 family)
MRIIKKKLICTFVLVGMLILMAGCADNTASTHTQDSASQLAKVLESEMAKEDAKSQQIDDEEVANSETSETTEENVEADSQNASENDELFNENNVSPEVSGDVDAGVDIDLTVLSADMVYAVVYDMMCKPDDYKGKTIKIEGIFTHYKDPNSGSEYFACIIEDAQACCSQGMEFIPRDEYVYPTNFPADFDGITVTGQFDVYQEGDFLYMTLRDAIIG